MDMDVLKRELMARAAVAADQAMAAVAKAPDGQWIAGSEWQIREIYQRLMEESFQEILQSRIQAHPAAELAAFPPCGRPVDPAGQGDAQPPRPDRRRGR
jgi:hypothetical protein